MRTLSLFFCPLAALGLILSIVVHFSTFAGVDPLDRFPLVWLLHIGIFVVFVPGIYTTRKKPARKDRSLASEFPYAPRRMAWMTGIFSAYALVNFVIFLGLMYEGQPKQQDDGTYAMKNHGKLVREINEEEFHRYQGYVARGFSGHWMAFYSASLLMLVSSARAPATRDRNRERLVDGAAPGDHEGAEA